MFSFTSLPKNLILFGATFLKILRMKIFSFTSFPKNNFFFSYISQYFTLEEGDLILTGTPAGVGPGKYLTIKFLRNLV